MSQLTSFIGTKLNSHMNLSLKEIFLLWYFLVFCFYK